jgi:pimeloyl-ACP methyl ester carboxylesterase
MPSGYYSLRNSRIHYSHWGTGNSLLFCFHGYGESSASFDFLCEAIGRQFTVVAIDLPFHGSTDWQDGLYLDPPDLLAILEQITAGLPVVQDDWWLLGYSMGGRVALQLVELAPQRIRWLVLLAPDGLRVNPWYWMATQTRLGNRFFRRTMQHPEWFFFFLRAANRLRMINPSVFKFTLQYIDDAEARRLLYIRWSVLSGFSPDLRKVGAIIRDRRIPVHLLYGRYDRIIKWQRGEEFRQLCAPYCQLTLLPSGHQLLQRKFMEVILSALYLPII